MRGERQKLKKVVLAFQMQSVHLVQDPFGQKDQLLHLDC